MAIVYGLKVNLSVAMVIMVNSTALRIESLQNQISTDCYTNSAQSLVPILIYNESSHLNETASQAESHCDKLHFDLTNATTPNPNMTETQKNQVSMHQNYVTIQSELGLKSIKENVKAI